MSARKRSHRCGVQPRWPVSSWYSSVALVAQNDVGGLIEVEAQGGDTGQIGDEEAHVGGTALSDLFPERRQFRLAGAAWSASFRPSLRGLCSTSSTPGLSVTPTERHPN